MSDKKLSGIKYDGNKIRMDLLPVAPITEVAKVLTTGVVKYDDNNWRGGFKYSRVFGAALRHIFAWIGGENKDPETGLSHLAHAVCCLLFLLEFEIHKTGEDDRYIYESQKKQEPEPLKSEIYLASRHTRTVNHSEGAD